MRKVTYSMGMSLDGYIIGPDGRFDWSEPDDQLYRNAMKQLQSVGVHLMGRRLYETMLFWETAEADPALDANGHAWAAVWNPLPKVVFSNTLTEVQGSNTRLASGTVTEEIERLQARRDRRCDACGRGSRSRPDRRIPHPHSPGARRRRYRVLPKRGTTSRPGTYRDRHLRLGHRLRPLPGEAVTKPAGPTSPYRTTAAGRQAPFDDRHAALTWQKHPSCTGMSRTIFDTGQDVIKKAPALAMTTLREESSRRVNTFVAGCVIGV